ncbi:MAG TPA: hypothetical protein VGF14_02875 [Alphaproteobacteria bacterium]
MVSRTAPFSYHENFIPSLDSRDYGVGVIAVGGNARGDVFLNAAPRFDFDSSHSAHLLANGIGTGLSYECPLVTASYKALKHFFKNGERAFNFKESLAPELFKLEGSRLGRYQSPSDLPGVNHVMAEFIETEAGFGGMRLQHGTHYRYGHTQPTPITWLYGPDNAELAKISGIEKYKKRRSLFRPIVEGAVNNRIANPVFMMNRPDMVAHGFYSDFYNLKDHSPIVRFSPENMIDAKQKMMHKDPYRNIIHSEINPYHVLIIDYIPGNGDLAVSTFSFGPTPDDLGMDDHAFRISQQARSEHHFNMYKVFGDKETISKNQEKPLQDPAILNRLTQTVVQLDEPSDDQAYIRIYRDNSGLTGIKVGHTNPAYDGAYKTPVVWTSNPAFEPLFDAVQTAHKNLYNL